MVDNQHKLSIRRQCNLLSIPRSGLYYNSKGEKTEYLEIMRLMDEHYMEYPTVWIHRYIPIYPNHRNHPIPRIHPNSKTNLVPNPKIWHPSSVVLKLA